MNITFMGTGTSHGVPAIDCMMRGYATCPQGVCEASRTDPRHRRTRSSLLLRWDEKNVLIDVGPDFREQCLREKVKHIDAVLLTHGHADHICGIPDIRSYTRTKVIPFFGSEETMKSVRRSFPYIFNPEAPVGGGIPRIDVRTVQTPFELFGTMVSPLPVDHLQLRGCYGYRIGPVAYIPDIKSIAPETLAELSGTQVLILNCLRRQRTHQSHLILSESMALARAVAPQRCFFIHMSHDIHYKIDKAMLDEWMDFAWDGLSLDI